MEVRIGVEDGEEEDEDALTKARRAAALPRNAPTRRDNDTDCANASSKPC